MQAAAADGVAGGHIEGITGMHFFSADAFDLDKQRATHDIACQINRQILIVRRFAGQQHFLKNFQTQVLALRKQEGITPSAVFHGLHGVTPKDEARFILHQCGGEEGGKIRSQCRQHFAKQRDGRRELVSFDRGEVARCYPGALRELPQGECLAGTQALDPASQGWCRVMRHDAASIAGMGTMVNSCAG
ncbi:MAG: hypothetical protein BWY76_02679 [bacterium ADurb.Bin429]|nr:MAG: hypothetical protein BWY76_02679 [bacterium ADurb.Bin429]